ncbi:MAG: hypothetical protein KDA37_16880 [Planctomycetales bacterium]|nr:hypothetical protein [Planctomycetales bacterium]
MDPTISSQIQTEVNCLGPADQLRVLEFVRSLNSTTPEENDAEGTPASVLLSFAGAIDPEDLKLMEQAIEEGCEQINPNGW